MANPNIVAVTAIYGNTSTNLISSTADPFATAIVNNTASSGKVYKINSIVVANVDGTAAADKCIVPLKKYKKCNLETVFGSSLGTIADINSGSLLLVSIGSLAASLNDGEMRWTVRVRYSDK